MKEQDPASKVFAKGLGVAVLGISAFLWFHEKSDTFALAVVWVIWSVNFVYAVATQEWRAFGVSVRVLSIRHIPPHPCNLFSSQPRPAPRFDTLVAACAGRCQTGWQTCSGPPRAFSSPTAPPPLSEWARALLYETERRCGAPTFEERREGTTGTARPAFALPAPFQRGCNTVIIQTSLRQRISAGSVFSDWSHVTCVLACDCRNPSVCAAAAQRACTADGHGCVRRLINVCVYWGHATVRRDQGERRTVACLQAMYVRTCLRPMYMCACCYCHRMHVAYGMLDVLACVRRAAAATLHPTPYTLHPKLDLMCASACVHVA